MNEVEELVLMASLSHDKLQTLAINTLILYGIRELPDIVSEVTPKRYFHRRQTLSNPNPDQTSSPG